MEERKSGAKNLQGKKKKMRKGEKRRKKGGKWEEKKKVGEVEGGKRREAERKIQ